METPPRVTDPPPGERPSARLLHHLGRFLAIATLVVSLDQATKAAIRGWLTPGERWPEGAELLVISHVQNTGAAFGILQGAGTFLVVATLATVGAITIFLLMLPAHSRWYPLALSLILGGAIGNLIDRLRLGHVTDFIDPTHYPAFNIADSAIVVGVIAVAALSLFERDERQPHREAGTHAEAGVHADAAAQPEPGEVRS
jgi:signal peptidase II